MLKTVAELEAAEGISKCLECGFFFTEAGRMAPQPSVTLYGGRHETILDGKIFGHGYCPDCRKGIEQRWKASFRSGDVEPGQVSRKAGEPVSGKKTVHRLPITEEQWGLVRSLPPGGSGMN